MSIKRIVKITIFLMIIICICIGSFLYLSLVFSFPKDQSADMAKERFNSYYAQPDNTLDGVFIGSSSVDRYWIPSHAYTNYGIAVYGLTSGNQPSVFIKYLMKEVLKDHDVDCFIVDIRGIAKDSSRINETDVRRVTDNMNMTLNRFKAVGSVLDYVGESETEIDTEDISYYFPLAKYYKRWSEGNMTKEDFVELRPEAEFMGYFGYNSNAFKMSSQDEPQIVNETGDIPEANKALLLDLLDYCDTLEQKVIFVTSPQSIGVDAQLKFNYIFKVVEERGYDTINFNTDEMYDALGWDFDKDLYNSGHANIYGAIKYTNYISEYLIDQLELSDHRIEESDKYDDFINAQEALIKKASDYDPELKKLLYNKQ